MHCTNITNAIYDILVLVMYFTCSVCRNAWIETLHRLFDTLSKIKTGSSNVHLAPQFNLNPSVVSRIIASWQAAAAAILKNFIVWPSKEAVRRQMPQCFHSSHRATRVIIDCTEIYIDQPSSLLRRAETWSDYKQNNTIKYLIGRNTGTSC